MTSSQVLNTFLELELCRLRVVFVHACGVVHVLLEVRGACYPSNLSRMGVSNMILLALSLVQLGHW